MTKFYGLLVGSTCAIFVLSVLGTAFCTSAAAREPKTDQGIAQQDDQAMQWFADAKFGMFIHWGVYAVPATGEWSMQWGAIPIDKYRKFATDQGDGKYFDAKEYDPAEWAKIAKESGMKYMCLTARHHEGFALFDSKHPNAWTSVQTIGRDLVAEYVKACRAADLRVGIYYSPMSWRYPGYYDVTGADCKKNNWKYTTDPAHKENARLMKEEVYEQVRTLFKNYGPFDYVFWDGAWLAQQGTDADAAFFWEPGKYRDPDNGWQVGAAYADRDETGRPLGLMGIVRKYSPRAICSPRSGWIGDFGVDEGGSGVRGPVRKDIWEKCLNLNQNTWGYNTEQKLMTYEQLVRYLVDVSIRNGNLLLNFGPDRHGRIPPEHAALTKRVGDWLKVTGDSIYGTRGGPWDPVDGQYGFTSKPGKYFIHILPGYTGNELTTPAIKDKITRCFDLFTGKDLSYTQNADGAVQITGIDREAHPADTVVAITTSTPGLRQ